jgi:hypothetical protein
MRNLFLLIAATSLIFSCNSKKTETITQDTLKVDTVAKVEMPQLAFSPIENYSIKKNVPLTDSVNFMLINSQREFDRIFTEGANASPIDFIINYTVAIACPSTDITTSIDIEKVELGENTINVFAKVTRGEKGKTTSIPARAFAIEKRDGYVSMDFYLNEKMAISLMLGVQ